MDGDDVLPWPDPFPTFKGYAFYEVDGPKIGKGTQVWSNEVMGETLAMKDSDSKDGLKSITYMYKSTLVKHGDNAIESVKRDAGNSVQLKVFAQGDLLRKLIRVNKTEIVSCTLSPESIEDMEDPSQWRFEISISADNKVWRSLDLGWMKLSGGNVDAGVEFLFAAPQSRPVICPHLDSRATDNNQNKMMTAWEMLNGSTLYISGTAHRIECSVMWKSVTQINTLEEQFYARVQLDLRWLACREDVYRYLMQVQGWLPAWLPEDISIQNVKVDSDVDVVAKSPWIEKVSGYVFVRRSVHISGFFSEPFELQSFPFDKQPLQIQLEMNSQDDTSFTFLCSTASQKCLNSSEWELIGFEHSCEPRVSGQSDRKHVLRIAARAQRRSFVYVVRIIVVMTLVAVLSLITFSLHPKDNMADRLANSITLLLTAVAYSLVVASSLPILGYLTILDKYVIAILAYISMIVIQSGVVGTFDAEDAEAWDKICFYSSIAVLVVTIAVTSSSVFCSLQAQEKPEISSARSSFGRKPAKILETE